MVFNTLTRVWEEPNVTQKELLLGIQVGDTEASGVMGAQRVVRLGRAIDGHTMRWLGVLLHAN